MEQQENLKSVTMDDNAFDLSNKILVEPINAEIIISHKKHIDPNDNEKILTGTKDYKEEFTESINKIRSTLKDKKLNNIHISNIVTKLQNMGFPGQDSLAPTVFLDLLTAEKIEILSTHVTIEYIENGLYSYDINYLAIIDGKKVTRNLNGYEPHQLYADLQLTGPYSIKFVIDDGHLSLSEALKNFKFQDEKKVKEFLSIYNISNITTQIKDYLGLSDLNAEKLTLKNHTSNSIQLVAAADAPKYQGEVTLTWNLKLFEIYGMGLESPVPILKDGLRVYFYLEANSNKIKIFNAMGYLSPGDAKMHSNYDDYHEFKFVNQDKEEILFVIKGQDWATQLPHKFGSFNFTTGVIVDVDSPELSRVKIFNKNSNEWEKVGKPSKFEINSLGEISKK
ncbi:MAG: hypothetical protein REH79_02740 [Spiroplasma sp.]|nr:hypothetical protein [Spiroplasma sp.]